MLNRIMYKKRKGKTLYMIIILIMMAVKRGQEGKLWECGLCCRAWPRRSCHPAGKFRDRKKRKKIGEITIIWKA